ncbi:hypothetical protein IAG41_04885 [Sphingomonas sp. JC676]|uniref:hypothetical protein n=1 Tax=Sphingomonas sp. JC676 TaxID=2768065 RepID=UPI001657DEA7|nr:hypothetical protein [Sphingomonas sp. JC676]MBC9031720.1 hypothetical protein [Sphingomonas sp. JC676]
MTVRIKAKADPDGIIRIKCGNDIIEIDLSDDDWPSTPTPVSPSNPADDPYTFYVADPFAADGIVKIVEQLNVVRADPTQLDPRIVSFVPQAALDVHDVARLVHGVESVLPDATLAFDLSGGGK